MTSVLIIKGVSPFRVCVCTLGSPVSSQSLMRSANMRALWEMNFGWKLLMMAFTTTALQRPSRTLPITSSRTGWEGGRGEEREYMYVNIDQEQSIKFNPIPQLPCEPHTEGSTQCLARRDGCSQADQDAGLPECSEHGLCSTKREKIFQKKFF